MIIPQTFTSYQIKQANYFHKERLNLQGNLSMLPSNKLNITSFSKLVRVTRTERKNEKKKVIEVDRSILTETLVFCYNCVISTILEGIYTHAQKIAERDLLLAKR